MNRSWLRAALHLPYVAYCVACFAVLALIVLTINLFLPNLRHRRAVAGKFGRAFLWFSRHALQGRGSRASAEVPCVVVANHASYIDAIAIVAALPPDFAFVIKKEMVRVPLMGLLLRRLGSQFVERFDRHKGARDARRVLKLAAAGQSLMFFPEGTFDETPQIGRFLGGAFATRAFADAGSRRRHPRHAGCHASRSGVWVHRTRSASRSSRSWRRRVQGTKAAS